MQLQKESLNKNGLDGPEWDLNPSPLSYQCSTASSELASSFLSGISYIYFHVFIPHRFIMNPQNDQLPGELTAQLIKCCTVITEVRG